jgi:hypothetical protein
MDCSNFWRNMENLLTLEPNLDLMLIAEDIVRLRSFPRSSFSSVEAMEVYKQLCTVSWMRPTVHTAYNPKNGVEQDTGRR